MSAACFTLFLGLLVAAPALAQIVIPANPRAFDRRSVGDTTNNGIDINPGKKTEAQARYTTYLVLADSRQWTSTDGKPLVGKLIAFEDLVVTAAQGSEAPAVPTPPAHPTVVRDGKVRIMVEQKRFEVPLARLSAPDQQFIEKIRAAHAKKPASAEP